MSETKLPTREQIAVALHDSAYASGFERERWLSEMMRSCYLREADAALSLIAPHVEALEREREEARRSQRKAEERADVFLDEHRDAVNERDAALARAERAEKERGDAINTLRIAALPSMPIADRDSYSLGYTATCAFCDWHSPDRMTTSEAAQEKSRAHMLACSAMHACLAPPPSASAGTGTISDGRLADLLEKTSWNAGYDQVSPWLAVARRAKELLGGSKAVKLPSVDELARAMCNACNRGYDKDQEFRESAWTAAPAALALVRAALAGRGETE